MMCNFLSGVTLENGDVLISKNTDSHHEILKEFNVRDTELPPAFCAWEFTPPIKNDRYDYAASTDQWTFNIDENFPTPEWWDSGREKLTINECKNRVNEFIVRNDVAEIISGRWIIVAGCVGNVRGNATIQDVRGNATIQDVWDNATIRNVWDNATIQDVWNNATIRNVWDNATIQDVRGNATIRNVWDNATIQDVWDNATIQDVRGNATIQDVWDNATIRNVWDNATIRNVWDNATIQDVWDNAVAIDNKTNIRIIITAKNRFEDK